MGLDPTELRLINQMTQGSPIIPPPKSLETANPIPDYVTQLKQAADYENRVENIRTFNEANKLYLLMF